MEITLPPETARRIREALEGEVDLAPAAVPAALSRLAVEAPAVYSQVLTEISGSQIRLDSERELQRRHRRRLLRRALFSWGEYKSDVGDRLIAKRRIAAAVPFGIAGFILILWGVSGVMTHRPGPALERGGVIHEKSTPSTDPRSERAAGSVLSARVLWPTQARVPPFLATKESASALFTRPLTTGTPSAPKNPVVFDRRQEPVLMVPSGLQTGRAVTPAPVVYDRGASEGGPPYASVSRGNHSGASAQAGEKWRPGQRVAARLATGVIVVVGGPPMPVIAESDGPGATWLGRATLGAEGLVQVTFTLASPQQGGVRGIALDPDRLVPGLAGRVSLRHSNAAAAVMAAALQATSDYVQALARRGEVTFADGWAQVPLGQTAPAWTYAASRLARVLDPGAGVEGPVETAEIAGGSRLMILVTETP